MALQDLDRDFREGLLVLDRDFLGGEGDCLLLLLLLDRPPPPPPFLTGE